LSSAIEDAQTIELDRNRRTTEVTRKDEIINGGHKEYQDGEVVEDPTTSVRLECPANETEEEKSMKSANRPIEVRTVSCDVIDCDWPVGIESFIISGLEKAFEGNIRK